MVMKWLGGGKPDHPLADEKGAKEVFESLKAGEAAEAIEDIRHWVESVASTEGFKPERRAELLLQLDEAAQPHLQKLARDYLATGQSKFQEARLWGVLAGFWTDMGAGYANVLEQVAADSGSAGRLKAHLPLLAVRAVRALAAQIKWHYLHYEPASAAAWASLGKVYRFAEAKKVQRESAPVYPRSPLASSAEREFVKALMLAASSPDCLMPFDIDLAERIVVHLAASFVLADAYQAQATHHWIDLAVGAGPKRLTETPQASPTVRFFAAGAAHAQLDEMIRVAESGALPSDLHLGVACEPARLLRVLRHLKLYWAATPPVRKHDRYDVKHRLNVVSGLPGVLARLREGAATEGAETWVTENISAGGIGAVVGAAQGGPGIGQLVGLSVEGGSSACTVGVVLRRHRLPDKQASVGIRTLAKESFPIALGGGEPDALLLNDGRTLKEEVLVCLREGAFDKRSSPTIAFEGGNYLLMPVAVSESGDEFEVARYRPIKQG